MSRVPPERINYGWIIGSGVVGVALLGAASVTQYALNWTGFPVETLISVGTAFLLAGALYFLQRRFVIGVVARTAESVATRTAETVAEAVVDEKVKELDARLDQLGERMNEVLTERHRRQDAAVEAMGVPTFYSIAGALAEANKLGAIADGQVRVQASNDRNELALDFSWRHERGDGRFSQAARDALTIEAHIYADQVGYGVRPVIATIWEAGEQAEQVGLRLREQLENRGRLKNATTLDWPMALRNLKQSVDLAIRSRRRDGTGWLKGALYELVTSGWAITDAGLETPGGGVVLAESAFPDLRGGGSAGMLKDWPPPAPGGMDQDLWDELLRRGSLHFPIRHLPFVSEPPWFPLTKPPQPTPSPR